MPDILQTYNCTEMYKRYVSLVKLNKNELIQLVLLMPTRSAMIRRKVGEAPKLKSVSGL